MTIGVLGGGAFGTALAISLSHNAPVHLWLRNAETARQVARTRKHPGRLPGVALPEEIQVTPDITDLDATQTLLLALPMQALGSFLRDHPDRFRNAALVACCKGMDLETGLGPVSILREARPGQVSAILTGPSFAADIARGLPTALTLATDDAVHALALQKALTTPNLRIYRTLDVLGAELGGALKNVIAIAAGATIGAGLGDSARAAVMTRGFAEMQRLAVQRGADPQTLSGLSGFGDLVLTCTSEQSRNFRFGLSLGRGDPFDPNITVEGAATALAISRNSREDLPITRAVAALVDGRIDVTEAMAELLSRPLREE